MLVGILAGGLGTRLARDQLARLMASGIDSAPGPGPASVPPLITEHDDTPELMSG